MKKRKKHSSGYILIYFQNHPYCNEEGYIMEHRLVMEKYLGRYLTKDEIVHHKNKKRDDNRIKNLRLFKNSGRHSLFHFKGKKSPNWIDGRTKDKEFQREQARIRKRENRKDYKKKEEQREREFEKHYKEKFYQEANPNYDNPYKNLTDVKQALTLNFISKSQAEMIIKDLEKKRNRFKYTKLQ